MPTSLILGLAKYGVASAIGLLLSWQLAQNIPTIKEEIISIKAMQTVSSDQHREDRAEQRNFNGAMLRIMRQQCLNGARNQEAIRNCNEG